jgi:hypothetical protein
MKKIINKYLSVKNNSDNALIVLKLLYDSLFLLTLFFAFSIAFEGVLPGVITSQISFSSLIIFIALNMTTIGVLSRTKKFSERLTRKTSSQLIGREKFALLIFLAILTFNSQLKLNIFLNIFLVIGAIAIAYLTLEIIFENKNDCN